MITHRRHRELWQQREDRYRRQQEDHCREEERHRKSVISIKIIGIARSSSTIGNKISSYRILETALSAMVIIGMIDQIRNIRTVIDGLTSRLEEGRQSMIGWGAGSVCMTNLVNVLVIF